jgi:hypothetical protein
MSGRGTAGLAAAGVGGVGGIAAAVLGSPVPVLVAGGLLGILVLTAAIVVLTAACSRNRHERAFRVLDRLLTAVPGAQVPAPPATTPPTPSRSEPAA